MKQHVTFFSNNLFEFQSLFGTSMKEVFGVLFLFCGFSFAVDEWSEFIAFWAPKSIAANQPYQVFFIPTVLDKKTEIAVQVAKKSVTVQLGDEKFDEISFVAKSIHTRKNVNMAVTLFRNSSSGVGKCITNSFSVKVDKKKLYVFVQTDKPIYKPGDEVKFRILVVDKHLKPHHMNNLNVYINDPSGKTIKEFYDLSNNKHIGVFKESFTLNSVTPLGDWTFKVVVDRLKNLPYTKSFSVQKYVLPLYNLDVKIPKNKILLRDNLQIIFEAKYSFGEPVIGNAELTIRDLINNREILRQNYPNVPGSKQLTFNVTALKIIQEKNLDFEATVKFTEPESEISLNKTVKFFVFGDPRFHIKVEHPNAFFPGHPINVLVRIYDWKRDPIIGIGDDLKIQYKYTNKNHQVTTAPYQIGAKSSVINHEIIIPENTTTLEIQASYINSHIYRYILLQGKDDRTIDDLIVTCNPQVITYEPSVNLLISGPEEMDTVIVDIVTRFGKHQSKEHKCGYKAVCNITLTIEDEMKPHSKILVYYVKDKDHVYKGQTHVESKKLAKNTLDFSLSTSKTQTKKTINLNFKGRDDSTIYLLAFDKRLSFLKKGNDITKGDVESTIADFDVDNFHFIEDMKLWHDCTPEELKRVHENRKLTTQQSGINQNEMFDDDQVVNLDEDAEEAEGIEEKQDSICYDEDCFMREKFPETWIFEEFTIDKNDEISKKFKVPDSITSWMISAFSLHNRLGLAIAEPKELIVKNEFFMEMSLPYSIRFKEVLRLDVLVHNYNENKDNMNATVFLDNRNGTEYEFIKYTETNSICSLTALNKTEGKQKVKIPYGQVRRASFYVRSKEVKEGFVDSLTFKCIAKATDEKKNVYFDVVQKILQVEPAGVREYEIKTFSGDTDEGGNFQGAIQTPKIVNSSTTVTEIDIVASGDYVVNDLGVLAQKTSETPVDLLGATSQLKAYAEISRLNAEKDKTKVESSYQQLMAKYQKSNEDYKSSLVYSAYFLDTKITALKLKSSISKTDIQDLKNIFDAMNFTISVDDYDSTIFIEGLTSHGQLAFSIIPFLKHRSVVNESYDKIITKTVDKLITNLDDVNLPYSIFDTEKSITAYALALNGNETFAKNITLTQEKKKFEYGGKKCYKIKKSDTKCNAVLTSYLALANMKLKNITDVLPTLKWLSDEFKQNQLNSKKLFDRALISEVFAEAGQFFKFRPSSLEIKLENDLKINKQIKKIDINSQNFKNLTHVQMPENSESISYSVTGTGFWSLSFVYEMLKISPQPSSVFDVKVEASDRKTTQNANTTTYMVKVCGKYKDSEKYKKEIPSIFYEVEMQSGYIYQSIAELRNQTVLKNINEIDVRKGNTLVIIHFLEYDKKNEHCVTIESRKAFDVKNPQKASVKVYDFNDRDAMAIEFYSFSKSCDVQSDNYV